jgi:hypothetical protein
VGASTAGEPRCPQLHDNEASRIATQGSQRPLIFDKDSKSDASNPVARASQGPYVSRVPAMSSVATTWGSTESERAFPFPCDHVLPDAPFDLYRAVGVDAPAPVVFRWLCQLRVAPYAYDFLDNRGRTSPTELTPGLEELAVGQRFMSIFTLAAFEVDKHVTLRIDAGGPRTTFGDLAVSYVVVPDGDARSRLVVKLRVNLPGDRVVGRMRRALLAWGDLLMMRKQLLTLKALAERACG